MNQKKQTGLTGFQLKLIALCTMFIDHIGAIVLEQGLLPRITNSVFLGVSLDYLPTDYQFFSYVNLVLRLIGRLAFPIYCFLLVEGFLHTRSIPKYALRLGLFAVISELPFDLALFDTWFDLRTQNVFFTLLFGLLTLWGMKWLETLPPQQQPFRYLLALTGMMLAEFVQTDYGAFGVLLLIVLYLFRSSRKWQSIAGAVLTLWQSFTAPLAFLCTYFYNGERGKTFPKYVFYTFYPLHLLLLYFVRTILF
ncbi:MAG: hypothetical protein J6J42_06160 [Lachnospiraceae bacterium]|nr:hypothetical protein [Lachnospiraceae bacterium]